MISLTPPTVDLNGCIISNNGTASSNINRRSKRVPTIDGGAVLVDMGWCEPDRSISLTLPATTAAQKAELDYLRQNYSTAVLCCADGCFEVVLSGLSLDGLMVGLIANVYRRLDV